MISTLKKEDSIVQVNPLFDPLSTDTPLEVRLECACEESELEEQWSYVGNKLNQNVGYGMPSIMQQIRCLPMSSVNAKTISFKNRKRYLLPSTSVVITRKIVVPMSEN